jgi:hypothetical protein
MSEFTKGPWTVHKNGRVVLAGGIRIYQSTGPGGAQSVQVQQRLDAELRANANLLAAAPELHEALECLLEWGQEPVREPCKQGWNKAVEKAEAALKKARGE